MNHKRDLPLKTWPKATIRAIAVANAVLGAAGLFLQADAAIRFSQRNQFSSSVPYLSYMFWVTASVSFALASIALISSFFLWRIDHRALRLCNWLFGAELVYWVGNGLLEVMLATSKSEWAHHFAMSMAGAGGIGNMGMAPQFLSLYPAWAIVILNFAYRRMDKVDPSFG
jgi:hypothetical protein